jgi:DNA invertase Pin-like site-specific DNA recombinase
MVGYYRVSTQRQGRSGLGLEAQRKAVQDHLRLTGAELLAEFTEVESGTRKARPQLAEALALCRKKRATLIIAKLDRLARNVHFVSGLLESRVDFLCCDMPEADRTFLQIAAVFAEWEARRISERTRSALAAAKARGTLLGANGKVLAAKNKAHADAFADTMSPILHRLAEQGITTTRSIADKLNEDRVRTARGGRWHPATVHYLRHRMSSLDHNNSVCAVESGAAMNETT